ncbi:MAG TPA: hypothetical protein IAA98_00035 [Candidatus Avipropionibacterium avicola]|uniref:Uncharacterized protein n=1 Tax=Candidatus Avipropionibacterium avicola TaxID=2840701 RepID=A0A9D1GW94_9ACTN|nr:hypothetical protein [Candidatus Avipropionibacterium avicola]
MVGMGHLWQGQMGRGQGGVVADLLPGVLAGQLDPVAVLSLHLFGGGQSDHQAGHGTAQHDGGIGCPATAGEGSNLAGQQLTTGLAAGEEGLQIGGDPRPFQREGPQLHREAEQVLARVLVRLVTHPQLGQDLLADGLLQTPTTVDMAIEGRGDAESLGDGVEAESIHADRAAGGDDVGPVDLTGSAGGRRRGAASYAGVGRRHESSRSLQGQLRVLHFTSRQVELDR